MADISQYAGFPLEFDPYSLQVTPGAGLAFHRSTRLGKDVKDVLCFPEQVEAREPVYMMDILQEAPEDIQAALDRYHLTYSLVLMPPGRYGREYVKTTGHYHPPIPGTTLGYPEVYTQLYGRLLLVLQRRSGGLPQRVMDYVVVEMTPGFVITIPPNYAHCLINPGSEPSLMAGLYGREFKPDYAMTRERHGLAYYLLAGADGKPEALVNQHYPKRPPITWLEQLEGTPFVPDFPGQPVWSAFLANQDAFAFLTTAEAAIRKFPEWE